jgi:hypothetical protein
MVNTGHSSPVNKTQDWRRKMRGNAAKTCGRGDALDGAFGRQASASNKPRSNMLLSNCCDASPWGGMEEMGICGDCKEHCEFYDDEVETEGEREFSPEQQAMIETLIERNKTCCYECDQKVARFSDGGKLHHETPDGKIDAEADADHEPWLQADRL